MAEPRAAWGIDLGQSALKAIKIRYLESANQLIAEAFDYIPYPKILSQPDAIPEEIVPQAMETFLSRNELKGNSVAISVPGQSALARFIQLPPVEASKVHEIVKYEARQQIPFALEDVIWDYQPLGVGMEEGGFLLDAEVGLFAMKRDQVYQQLRPYNNAKVEVELIQIAPLALYNLLSFDELGIRRDSTSEPGDEYTIVLDMGCDNTTLMVSNGYKIWIRNVPIGGNHFTRALTKEMKLSFAKAEHLKCNATKSPDPRAVFQALRPVFNDYVSEIQRSIGYFSSVNRAAKVVKVMGLGNGFKLAGLQKFLQQNLQYEVVRPDNFQALAGDSVLNSPLFAENLLSFAVPYGLALQGLNLTRIKTSLLPPEIASARRIRRKKPWAVAAATLLLAALSLSTAGNANSYRAVNTAEFAAAEAEKKKFDDELSGLKSKYTRETSRFKAAEDKLNSLTAGRRTIKWIDVYNAVIDCIPREEEGEEAPPDDIGAKKTMSIHEFSHERVADVSMWFSTLKPHQLENMLPADKESPPSGEGYIISIRGEHWKHDPSDPQFPDMFFVRDHLLSKLKQDFVQRPGFPRRDVRRLGLTHAAIIEEKQEEIKTGADGTPAPILNIPGVDPRFLTPDNPKPPTDSNGEPIEVKPLHRTDFLIQCVLQYKPENERPPLETAAATEPASTDEAGSTP